MFRKKDPNSFTKNYKLNIGIDQIGYLIAEYQVKEYNDVQTQNFLSVNKAKNRNYLVHCTQRIVICGSNQINIPASCDVDSYNNYPVLIDTSLVINSDTDNDIAEGLAIQLLDYSPKTVNTQIQTSGTLGSSNGEASSSSTSSTKGSSNSETNSFGYSVSAGLDKLNDSASFHGEKSSSVSYDQSNTIGSDSSVSKSNNSSESSSTSIKDWGGYAYIDQFRQKSNWLFGQEYPWNAINCRKTNGSFNPNNKNQVNLIIPKDMQVRLYDQVSLLPPSQLSMFGVNFVMQAAWLVTLDDNISDEVSIDHSVFYYSASHLLIKDSVNVFIDQQPAMLQNQDAVKLNLPLMALDVLGLPNKQAIIGFIPNKFTVLPIPVKNGSVTRFKIISTSNTIYIRDTTIYPDGCDDGAGFYASETVFTAIFSQKCTSLSMTAYFKVVDTVSDYNLYLKHWKKQGSKGIKLSLVINEDQLNTIVKYVDDEEAEGAEKNLLTIALRNQDYASIDYHDYLQLGLNSIEIKIEPIYGKYVGCGYQIRALSIE